MLAQVIAEANGGVLFIDEAYRLAEAGGKDFGREAIERFAHVPPASVGSFSTPEVVTQVGTNSSYLEHARSVAARATAAADAPQ